jgi:bacteriorhodopsin
LCVCVSENMAEKIIKAISEVNLKNHTSLINTVVFLSYSLDEYNFSKDSRLKRNERNALLYSSVLLGIAGLHYSAINSSNLSIQSEILIRYSDWILTTPLLLKVLSAYYDISDAISYELIAYNLIMIISGLIYELTNNIRFWIVGVISYLKLIHRLYVVLPNLDFFFKYFVVGWGLYGIVALMPKKERLVIYNVLDFYNKLIFAVEVRLLISKNLRNRSSQL